LLAEPAVEWLREQLMTQQASPLTEAFAVAAAVGCTGDRIRLTMPPLVALSSREIAVPVIAQGCSNQEIGDCLFILHTVKTPYPPSTASFQRWAYRDGGPKA
jgi:ATP/maltotriose-dependent transcriptional regulator MalT